jgi:hypothetical protein
MSSHPARRREALRVSTFVAGGIALSLGLSGCADGTASSSQSVKTCVDQQQQQVADDVNCGTTGTGGHAGSSGYAWRYYNGGYVPATGESTTSKGATPLTSARSGTSTVKSGSVSRGGFGSGSGKGSVGG